MFGNTVCEQHEYQKYGACTKRRNVETKRPKRNGRNHRNETKRPKRNDRNDRNETTETAENINYRKNGKH